MIRIGTLSAAAGLACSILAGAALAEAPFRAPAVQSVLDCRKIDDATQRLACYDKAVSVMQTAEDTGDLVSVDRQQRTAARHQAFGLTLPTLSFLDRGEKPEEVDHITAKVVSAWQVAYGKWVVRLDDGAVWRQIDDNVLDHPVHAGSVAEIRRGVLGSFTIKIDGQFPFKAHRDS